MFRERHESVWLKREEDFSKAIPLWLRAKEEKQTRIRTLWLHEESALVARLAHRHWGIQGTFAAIGEHFGQHLERYAMLALWHACLGAYGLNDPLSPSDPDYLQQQDPDGAIVEGLSAKISRWEQWGGAPIPITAKLSKAIDRVINKELEHLRSLEKEGGDAAHILEAAHLCWTVRHDLEEHRLNRRGVDAFKTLLSLEKTRKGARGKDHDLIVQLRKNDPMHRKLQHERQILEEALSGFESGRSHSDFLKQMTGVDIVDTVNKYMIRLTSVFLDEGLSAWHMPGRALGFYDGWKLLVEEDKTFDFEGLGAWRGDLHRLPMLPEDAIIQQLQELGIPEEHWTPYLGRILIGLRGWAAMVYWMEGNPDYPKQTVQPVDAIGYLAVRMFYENLLVRKLCRKTWQLDASLGSLRHYGETHLSEIYARNELFAGHLPEYLAHQARALTNDPSIGGSGDDHWQALANEIWLIHEVTEPHRQAGDTAWRLFHLAQFLGLSAGEIIALPKGDRTRLMGALEAFPESAHGIVWLIASESHYLDEVLNALSLNVGKGRWQNRKKKRPSAQVVFCIDEREEAIHRHLEELDPDIETMGAAGFFGLPIDYTGMGEHHSTPLCPAPVTPGHRVMEVARPEDAHTSFPVTERRTKWLEVFHDAYWEVKRNLVSSFFLFNIVGFLMAVPLIGRVFFRNKFDAALVAGHRMLVPHTETELTITQADDAGSDGHGEKPLGFTNDEQADKLTGLLQNIGLIPAAVRFESFGIPKSVEI